MPEAALVMTPAHARPEVTTNDHRDSIFKMIALALRQIGVGVIVFAIATIVSTRFREIALRALTGLTSLIIGVIIERSRRA
jgi:hypothetical protein